MLQKVENLLKKFWKGIVIIVELIIISIFVIDSLNSQNEFKEFKNSKATHYFWNGNTYKSNSNFTEVFILKNTDLLNSTISLEFNNNVENVEFLSLNGEKLDKVFNYEILSNPKDSIKEFQINKNSIVLKLIPNKGIAKVKIGFKKNINLNDLRKEDQLLVRISNYHSAE